MNRFENVDVLAALEQLMRQNTAFYRNDFEIDKEIIRQAAASDRAEDKKPKQTRPASKTAQRQKKPSIRAQLKAAKEEQAKKPPQREKSKELEV